MSILNGVPFMGNKTKIVEELLSVIFSRHNDMTDFYDLCGGGGCVSFNASQNRNILVHYNEIREEIYNLISFIVFNDKMPDDWWDWVSREEFYECRNKVDAKSSMIKLVWSFGNRGISGGYIYGKEIVDLKYLAHQFVKFNDLEAINKIINEYHIDISEDMSNATMYERRIYLQNQAKKADNNKCQLEHIQRLERINDNFLNLFRTQHIERLEKVNNNFRDNSNIVTTNVSYEEVEITGNKPVIYCDIPYNSTKTYDGIKFDYEKFYNWARNCSFPVYFSEYSAPDDFICVWSKEKYCAISSYKESRSTHIERLFWNGIK